jgi:HEPN domain-containing protein
MRELTSEWIRYADDDYEVAEYLMARKERPIYFSVCFHVQQAVEKYLKAFLVENFIEIEKTHDLSRILDLILPIKPEWELHRSPLNALIQFAVANRYPNEAEAIDRETAIDALAIAKEMRQLVRDELKIY